MEQHEAPRKADLKLTRSDTTDNNSSSTKSTAEQQHKLFKLTLNDSETDLLEKMSENGSARPLSVPPSLTTNQDAVDLVDQVDGLIQEITVNFSAAVKEVYQKRASTLSPSEALDFALGASPTRTSEHKLTFTVDDMAARIDAMEARALAAQAAEEAEAAAKKESK